MKTAVSLTWLDSCTESEWADDDPSADHRLVTIHSLGWMLSRTQTTLTIAQSFDSEGHTAERLTVPTACLIDVTFLTP